MAGTEQLGLIFQAPPRKIYAVRELVAAVAHPTGTAFTDVYVEGEISNYRPAESGHLYFTLKDGSAQLRAVMWRTQARLLRFRPENGLQVIARGRVTVYDERGDLQFQAEHLEPKGAGALQIAFEQLKTKLAAEGLFDPARKKPIPALPRRIGLVTSPRGAAVQDILNILRRRHESVNVLIYPAQVQGDVAASEVSAACATSIGTAMSTSSSWLAAAVRSKTSSPSTTKAWRASLPLPTFRSSPPSAMRPISPSAILSPTCARRRLRPRRNWSSAPSRSCRRSCWRFRKRLAQAMNYKLLRANNELSNLVQHAVFARMQDSIARRQQRVDDLVFRLAQSQSRILKHHARRIDALEAHLRRHDLRVRTGEMRRQLESRATELNYRISRAAGDAHGTKWTG